MLKMIIKIDIDDSIKILITYHSKIIIKLRTHFKMSKFKSTNIDVNFFIIFLLLR